jgi:hypothetical protein
VFAGLGTAATFGGFYQGALASEVVVEILLEWSTPFSPGDSSPMRGVDMCPRPFAHS